MKYVALALSLLSSTVYAQPSLLLLPEVKYEVSQMSSGKYLYKFNSPIKATDIYTFMVSAIYNTYDPNAGKHIENKLEFYSRGSMNVVSLNAQNHKYLALPQKNSNNKIESIIFWQED